MPVTEGVAPIKLAASIQCQVLHSCGLPPAGMDNFLAFLGNSLLATVGLRLLAAFISVVTAVLTRSAGEAVGISMAYALAVETLQRHPPQCREVAPDQRLPGSRQRQLCGALTWPRWQSDRCG